MEIDFDRAKKISNLIINYAGKIKNQSYFDSFMFSAIAEKFDQETKMIKQAMEDKSLRSKNYNTNSQLQIVSQYCPKVSIITSISIMDAFLSDLLKMLLLMFPDSLENPVIPLKEILECKDINEILSKEIEKKVRSFSYDSFSKRFQRIQKRFKLDFKGLDKQATCLNAAWEIRNKIIHECEYAISYNGIETVESMTKLKDEGAFYMKLANEMFHTNQTVTKKISLEVRNKLIKEPSLQDFLDETINKIFPT